MIIFQNPGLIPLEGVTIMGMSAKREGSFGMFGTGIKYSVATILRGGGTITIYRGKEAHRFTTRPVTMWGDTDRAKDFEVIQLDGVDMGIATNLGLNWKPWMVLREFGCNAKDEGGSFWQGDNGFDPAIHKRVLKADHTTVAIEWAALDDAFKHQDKLFLEGEPVFADENIRVLPGISSHLYYRGVRVFDLKKPSKLTYDLLGYQTLTEDRTLYGDWNFKDWAPAALMQIKDTSILADVIACGEGYAEYDLDFKAAWDGDVKPTREFIDTAIEERERKNSKVGSNVKELLGKHMRHAATERHGGSAPYERPVHEPYAYAIEILQWAKVVDTEGNGPEVMVIPISETPGDIDAMSEGGRIYIHERVLRLNSLEIARILLPRFMELRFPARADAIEHLGAALLAQHHEVARYLKMIEEDEKLKAAADEAPVDPPMQPENAV